MYTDPKCETATRAQRAAESPLVDKPGAADYLGVCPRTVDNYAKDGRLPFVKFGSRVLFRKAGLDERIACNVRRRSCGS